MTHPRRKPLVADLFHPQDRAGAIRESVKTATGRANGEMLGGPRRLEIVGFPIDDKG